MYKLLFVLGATLVFSAHARANQNKPSQLIAAKAMDCEECADKYCNGDKSCEECAPICGKGSKKAAKKNRKPAAKAMDCEECAEHYCEGDKSCEACAPICGGGGGGKAAEHWRCECDDGSGDGGFSDGKTQAEAKANCKKMNHGKGKVGSCDKD